MLGEKPVESKAVLDAGRNALAVDADLILLAQMLSGARHSGRGGGLGVHQNLYSNLFFAMHLTIKSDVYRL